MQLLLARLHAGAHPNLTAFFSLHYLALFLPVCLLVYAVTPAKWKRYLLLAVSLGFFWLISGLRILYLMVSILSVWMGGLWIDRLYRQRDAEVKAAEKAQRKAIKKVYQTRSRWVLALLVCLNIGILLVVKYTGFLFTNLNAAFGLTLNIPKFLMPIGISFYSLQAVSYTVDVYRETIPADRNLLRLSLFFSFFPQIVEGPIVRYGQTADQLWNVGQIRYENLTLGLQRVLYGMMKKMVVADRLELLIATIFTEYNRIPGCWVFIGAVAYTIQLYMDFSGSMDAVCGIAQIFGITMPENFRQPFFSRTVSEFWTRWHISLGTWFKDYVFYPITMSKPMKNMTSAARKKIGNHFGPLIAGSIALFCVWFCNGLWHGAAWTFLCFGMYHFAIILTGNIIAPYVKSLNHTLHISADSWPYRLMQTLRTFCLVAFGEMIFRAESMRDFIGMLGFSKFFFFIDDWSRTKFRSLGIDYEDMAIVLVTVIIVFVVSLLKERGVQIRQSLSTKPTAVRWALIFALIFYIIIFGAYGAGYVPVNPMYANF